MSNAEAWHAVIKQSYFLFCFWLVQLTIVRYILWYFRFYLCTASIRRTNKVLHTRKKWHIRMIVRHIKIKNINTSKNNSFWIEKSRKKRKVQSTNFEHRLVASSFSSSLPHILLVHCFALTYCHILVRRAFVLVPFDSIQGAWQ